MMTVKEAAAFVRQMRRLGVQQFKFDALDVTFSPKTSKTIRTQKHMDDVVDPTSVEAEEEDQRRIAQETLTYWSSTQ